MALGLTGWMAASTPRLEIHVGGGKTPTSVITCHCADALGLRTGEPVSALFDAGHVILVVD
jgi:molybdopterin-binding protein